MAVSGAEAKSDRVVARLAGFSIGIGLDSAEARQIVERVIADDPSAEERDIEAKARAWMLIALA